MQNEAGGIRRRRRGQKERQVQPNLNPLISKKRPANARSDAIRTHIKQLDSAKRRVKVFNKVALCVAAICVGRNIYTVLSKRRRSGGVERAFFGWGEAFQSIKLLGKKKNRNHYWTLFRSSNEQQNHPEIPREMLQPFGSYPNLLNITAEMRSAFHPVIKIPLRNLEGGPNNDCIEPTSQPRSFWPWQKRNRNNRPTQGDASSCIASKGILNETYDYIIRDYTINNKDTRVLFRNGKRVPQLMPTREEAIEYAKLPEQPKPFDVGRYDEDRRNMYTSKLFTEEDFETKRSIHVGLDIGAPIGTAVHAFEDGVIHSVGYNPEVGDYGHVIVIEHHLKNHGKATKVYALYGHLSAKSIKGKVSGLQIKKGEVIGYLGNAAENGGWTGTHVHFQLARNPPPTHDMPGVVAPADREKALLEYVDPRYVCGELY